MGLDIVSLFQSFRTILCVCPCCGSLVRLSDLHLKYKGKAPRTWLDSYGSKLRRIEKQETEFEEIEQKMREAAHERARQQVPKLIRKCIDTRLARLRYDPYDIKVLLHPVDFVVFNGLKTGDELKDITFLSKGTRNQSLNKIRISLLTAIDEEMYDWKIMRISLDGKFQIG